MSELKAAGVEATLVVPKAWTIVRTAEFPSTVRGHLPDVVAFELDRLTPLTTERALYDFQVLGEEDGRIRIQLAVVKADDLQPYLAALQKRGIAVGRVAVGLSALGTLSRFLHGGGDTVFVTIHPGGYEGGWVKDGRWVGSIAGGIADGGEESGLLVVAGEVNALLDRLKEQGGSPPAVMVHRDVPGGSWTSLQTGINAPVRFLGESDLSPLVLASGGRENLSYAALGGLLESLWPGARGMNLLTRGIHPPARTPLAASAVLLIALAALGLFWLISPLTFAERKIEAIDREIAARRDEVLKIEAVKRDLDGVEKEIATIHSFKNAQPVKLNLLKEIATVLPKTAWLSRARITDAAVEIEGYASSATEILPRLEASPYFKKVEFAAPTSRDTRLNMDRFSIKMEIEGLPEGKVDHEAKK